MLTLETVPKDLEGEVSGHEVSLESEAVRKKLCSWEENLVPAFQLSNTEQMAWDRGRISSSRLHLFVAEGKLLFEAMGGREKFC